MKDSYFRSRFSCYLWERLWDLPEVGYCWRRQEPAAGGSYSPRGRRLEGRATGRRWLLPRGSTSCDSLGGYRDAAVQNCLAKVESCSEDPVNTSSPWGQISRDSRWLGSLPQAPVSMATLDASLEFPRPSPSPALQRTVPRATTAARSPSVPGEMLGSSACLRASWSPLLRSHRLRDPSKPRPRDRNSQNLRFGVVLVLSH